MEAFKLFASQFTFLGFSQKKKVLRQASFEKKVQKSKDSASLLIKSRHANVFVQNSGACGNNRKF